MKLKRSILQATFFLAIIAASLTLAGPARAQAVSVRFSGKFTLTSPVRWGKATLPPGTYGLSIDSVSRPIIATIRNDRDTHVATVMTLTIEDYSRGSNALQLKTRNGQAVVQSLVLGDLNMILVFDPSPAHERVEEARVNSTVVLVARK